MKKISLMKRMIFQVFITCAIFVGISIFSIYSMKGISDSFKGVALDQFPKVESASKMVAKFRSIRINVRTLGLEGNSESIQKKYIGETKKAISEFLKEKEAFDKMQFSPEEEVYREKLNKGWEEFFMFGKDLLSKYVNPTEESLTEGAHMIREICPVKAAKWMNVAEDFLKLQSQSTQDNVLLNTKKEKETFLYTVIGLGLSLTLAFILSFSFSRRLSKRIQELATRLADNAKEVLETSEGISSRSLELSKSSTESASSLQETVSSIDEISSMIQRNADSASSSTKMSEKSSKVAGHGKEVVGSMIKSIQDISDSNDELAEEMQKSNQDISKIVEVISEIGDKTKIINDIVFQTKLLSFNASVEAARAGEHGKGFAVVAEEVGNLASMSGKAALEITEMLDKSIKQVTEIVDDSKKKVEGLVSNSKNKVQEGTKTAHECGTVLDEILQNVNSVNEMVREIALASSEQSAGVQEVTKAMQQIDQITHQNSSAAQESSATSERLKGQAGELGKAVEELMVVVSGEGEVSKSEEKSEDQLDIKDDHKVINLPKRNRDEIVSRSNSLKVSGLDSDIPGEEDPRFEDL